MVIFHQLLRAAGQELLENVEWDDFTTTLEDPGLTSMLGALMKNGSALAGAQQRLLSAGRRSL